MLATQPRPNDVETVSSIPQNPVLVKVEKFFIQALELAKGKPFDEVCVDPDDPRILHIRLGGELGFIERLLLSEGRTVLNMHYVAKAACTPTRIVELFKPFGASTGQDVADKLRADIMGGIPMDKPQISFVEVENIANEINALRIILGSMAIDTEDSAADAAHFTPALNYITAALYGCYKRLWKYVEEEPIA